MSNNQVSFWQHFYVREPDLLASRVVAYQERFGLSVLKLMPDVPIGFVEGSVTRWDQVNGLQGSRTLSGADDYVAAARQARRLGEPSVRLWATVFTPLGLLGVWSSNRLLSEFRDVDAAARHSVLRGLARGTEKLIEELAASGVDVIYLSAWGSDVLTRDEYCEYGYPYDLWVIESARRVGEWALHIHGSRGLRIDWYSEYKPSVVGWSEGSSGVRWDDGIKEFNGSRLLGGIDEIGPFDDMWVERQKARIRELRSGVKDRLIVGPGCSLPVEVPDQYLVDLAAFVREGS